MFTFKHYCPVCKSNVKRFNRLPDYYLENLQKNKFVFSIFLFETLNLLGYSCPKCEASDRDRLFAIFFDERLKNDLNKNYMFIDFAPSAPLSKFFKKNFKLKYRTADLYMDNVDDKVDLRNLDYDNESFDVFLCSHILEHIDDDNKAASELYRILSDDGFGIVMAPIHLGIEKNIEKDEYNTNELRWKYYGQDDHVRLYSKQGFMDVLQNVGFKIFCLGVENFSEDIFKKCGIHKDSILYLVRK